MILLVFSPLKGQCDSDTQRHEGYQTAPRWLVSMERSDVFHPNGGSLHYDLRANQGTDSHLGQTHPYHCGGAPTMEGESAQRICEKNLLIVFISAVVIS